MRFDGDLVREFDKTPFTDAQTIVDRQLQLLKGGWRFTTRGYPLALATGAVEEAFDPLRRRAEWNNLATALLCDMENHLGASGKPGPRTTRYALGGPGNHTPALFLSHGNTTNFPHDFDFSRGVEKLYAHAPRLQHPHTDKRKRHSYSHGAVETEQSLAEIGRRRA